MNPVRMRRILAPLCMLNASLALAQFQPVPAQPPPGTTEMRGTDIPMGEVALILYQSTTGAGSSTGGSRQATRLQGQLQIDDLKFQALLEHMRAALAEFGSFELGQMRSLCTRRQELTTVPKLAAALKENERLRDARKELLTQGAESILGAAGKARLDAAIDERRRGTVVRKVDYEAAMIAEKRSATAVLTQMCSDSAIAQ